MYSHSILIVGTFATFASAYAADDPDFGVSQVSDSRTADPTYTSSCEDKLFGTINSAFPRPTNSELMKYMAEDECFETIPADLSSDLSDYESTVTSWWAPMSSDYQAFFANECPYLSAYEFTMINGVFAPVPCTSIKGVGFASAATTTAATTKNAATATGKTSEGSATATGSASSEVSAGETGTIAGSATSTNSTIPATIPTTASNATATSTTSSSTTAVVNGASRATGLTMAAMAMAGILGVVAAL